MSDLSYDSLVEFMPDVYKDVIAYCVAYFLVSSFANAVFRYSSDDDCIER